MLVTLIDFQLGCFIVAPHTYWFAFKHRRLMARKLTMLSLAIVLLVVSVTHAKQRVYPLGVNLTTYFSCESVPKNNLSCPGDIKTVAGTGATVKMTMDAIYASLESQKNYANESCIKAVVKSSCFSFPRCERERIYVDIPAAILACEAARRVCPKLIKDSMLNCEEKKSLYERLSFNATKFQCKNIKDSTGTCPDIKYKYVDDPSENIAESFDEIKLELQSLKSILTSECYRKVRNTVCLLAVTNYCSPDETFAVSYISKQECEKRLLCIPEQSYPNGTKFRPSDHACRHLPDQSKGIDLPDPNNGASFLIPTASFVLTATLLLNSLQFL